MKDLQERIKEKQWYHSIKLGDITTPGLPFDDLWNLIRTNLNTLDYNNKRVLDLASWDGMWAFEAEQRGAGYVAATDLHPYALDNFLLCREALNSKVQPFYNASVYDIAKRIEPVFYEKNEHNLLFDIVQNLGMMYHLKDPMYALASCRTVIKNGGTMVIETAIIPNDDKSYMMLNGPSTRLYKDPTTYWVPTLPCLKEMLTLNFFRPIDESLLILEQDNMARACMLAEAIPLYDYDHGLPPITVDSFMNPFQTPGAALSTNK